MWFIMSIIPQESCFLSVCNAKIRENLNLYNISISCPEPDLDIFLSIFYWLVQLTITDH